RLKPFGEIEQPLIRLGILGNALATHPRLGKIGSMRAREPLIPRPPIYPGQRCLARKPPGQKSHIEHIEREFLTLTRFQGLVLPSILKYTETIEPLVATCGGNKMCDRRTWDEYESIPLDTNSITQHQLNIDAKERSNLFPWNGQFSPQLIELLLKAYARPDTFVFDPFLGS